jgi:hypothetical protein
MFLIKDRILASEVKVYRAQKRKRKRESERKRERKRERKKR